MAGELSPTALQPHPVAAPSSFSPTVLLESVSLLGSDVPWSDGVSIGNARARETWAWSPPFRSLFALTRGRSVGSKNFFFLKKSTKTRPRKKTKSGGERANLLFKAPKSGVGRWCSSKRGGRRAPRGGVQLVLQAPQELSVVRLGELASAAVPWVLGLPRTLCLCPHLKGLFRFTSLFVLLYMRVHVHICLCLCRWVKLSGGCVCTRVCVCVCVHVRVCVHG